MMKLIIFIIEGTEASKIFKVHIYGVPSSGFETLLYSDFVKLFNFSVLQFLVCKLWMIPVKNVGRIKLGDTC